MVGLIVGIVIVAVLGLVLLTLTLHIIQQYEKGVVFRFGRRTPRLEQIWPHPPPGRLPGGDQRQHRRLAGTHAM